MPCDLMIHRYGARCTNYVHQVRPLRLPVQRTCMTIRDKGMAEQTTLLDPGAYMHYYSYYYT